MMIMCEEQLVDTPIAYEDQLKSYIVFFGTKHIVKWQKQMTKYYFYNKKSMSISSQLKPPGQENDKTIYFWDLCMSNKGSPGTRVPVKFPYSGFLGGSNAL